MPWQQQVADVAFELLPNGLPAYRKVIVSVPRQNGKTTLLLAVEVHRCLLWGRPVLVIYTAQNGLAARKKLLEDQVPILERSPIWVAVGDDNVYKAAGAECVRFRTAHKAKSRIALQASGESSGHGETVDLGVIDEAWHDADNRREAALTPAQLTKADAQLLVFSTMGTERSAYFNGIVDSGRSAVADGLTTGIAYFEWSAPDDAPIDDPATWRGCMPALGITITEEVVRQELEAARRQGKEGEFRRAMLNQRTVSDERVIPAAIWNPLCGDSVAPDGRMVLGIDTNPERSYSALVAADTNKRVELVEYREGTHWVVEQAVKIAKAQGVDVVLDDKGPAASFARELEAEDVTVHRYSTADMARACGNVFDWCADGQLSVRRHPVLDEAAAALRKRQTGDVWVWGRRDADKDVCPFVALTLAVDKAAEQGDPDADVWAAWD